MSLEPPPHLAATDLNRQVFTVFKFIFSTKIFFSVIDFLISNLLLHAYRLVTQKEASKVCWNDQNRCRILIKAQILPSHFSRHLQGHFFFRKLSLKHALVILTQSSSYWLYLLLFLLFGFGPQGPMGSM